MTTQATNPKRWSTWQKSWQEDKEIERVRSGLAFYLTLALIVAGLVIVLSSLL